MQKSEVTIYDIARELELSPATVSRALNGLYAVRKETRARIVQKARDLGYRQNFFASKLRSQRTRVIGAVVPKLNTPFASNFVAGAEITARSLGYNLTVSQSMNDPELHFSSIENINKGYIEGLLVTSISCNDLDSIRRTNVSTGIPTVLIEGTSALHRRPRKTMNSNFETAYELTTQLVKRGCKRIVYIAAGSNIVRHTDLLNGYRQALHDNNLVEIDKFVLVGYDFDQFGIDMCRLLLSTTSPPDGIIFSDKILTALSVPDYIQPGFCSDRLVHTTSDNSLAADRDLIVELGKVATGLLIALVERAAEERAGPSVS